MIKAGKMTFLKPITPQEHKLLLDMCAKQMEKNGHVNLTAMEDILGRPATSLRWYLGKAKFSYVEKRDKLKPFVDGVKIPKGVVMVHGMTGKDVDYA